MHTVPLITVIVPSYNSPDIFLTLRSVLAQDYPRIQLILADDASAVFSEPDIRDYLEKNNRGNLEQIQILVNPENYGTVRTMNQALQLCRGEYIFNLAGDDCFYDSHVLSDWTAEFIRTGAQVITAYRAVYDSRLQTQRSVEPTPAQVRDLQTKTPQALFEKIAATNFIFGCCTARTAACIEKYGLFDPSYRLLEDHPMNLKLLRQGEPIRFFDRIVVKYRSGGTSSAANYNAAYEKDVDTVLTHDVLPYTRCPLRMRWLYFQWKRDQRLLRRRARALMQHDGSPLAKLMIQFWYYLHHPFRTFCRLPGHLLKKYEEHKQHGSN